jgi:acyl-CoA synthetase (AMP-forming)/AMP-acid ligase II
MIVQSLFPQSLKQHVFTLVDILRQRAQSQPDQKAFIFLQDGEIESDSLTYQQLDKQARAIAAQLQCNGSSEERALLLYPPGLEFIAAFFGCLYAGFVAVPAYPPRANQNMSRLEAIVTDAQVKVILTTASLLNDISSRLPQIPEMADLYCVATDSLNSNLEFTWVESIYKSENLAFLQYTSGSTGTPKGVMVSHGNLMYNEEMIKEAFQHTEKSIVVGWLPLFHDMGLIGNVLQPLYMGIPCYLMSPLAFLQKPLRWLQAISRYKATTSGGPNFAYDLCVRKITPEQRASLDLSSWDIAFNGAEPIRAQTLEVFARTFADCGFRPQSFYPCYGMAETTLLVSGGLKIESPTVCSVEEIALEQNWVVAIQNEDSATKKIVGCGQTWLDEKIAIVNPENLTLCSPDQVGEIWVSGEHVAQGYWNRPEETKQTFHGYLDGGTEPFLRTGDLGFLHDGELFVTGRLKDVIIVRGRNHYPQDIELTVSQSHPALRLDSGAALTILLNEQEELVIVHEASNHDLQVYAVLLLKTSSIPKTSSGKIRRNACRAGFLDNSLNVVASWSKTSC